jgi:hypothetical protein
MLRVNIYSFKFKERLNFFKSLKHFFFRKTSQQSNKVFSYDSDSSSAETIIFTKSTERHFTFLQVTLAQLNLNFVSATNCGSRIEESSFYFSYYPAHF